MALFCTPSHSSPFVTCVRMWYGVWTCKGFSVQVMLACLRGYAPKMKYNCLSMSFLHLCRMWELCASIRLSRPGHRALHWEKEGSLEAEKAKWWGCVYSNSACLAVIGNLEPCFWKSYMLLTVPQLSTMHIVCTCVCVRTHTHTHTRTHTKGVTSFVSFFSVSCWYINSSYFDHSIRH